MSNAFGYGQLFHGHTKFRRVYHARAQVQLRDCILQHVSAHGLTSLVAPSSLKQHLNMNHGDKNIWDAAYDEEFDGLSSLPTWQVITEEQFRQLSKGVKALPTMAIAAIKYDAHNPPKRAKYRIVKKCDIKHAFVHSSLPEDEIYFLKPPQGCPHSTPGTYWHIIRYLYGLLRAPKLWFEKLCYYLKAMGLRCSDTSPCRFVGHPIDGEPPIYLGFYVDDIMYFSTSDKVERKFENLLSTIGDVEFLVLVTQFLGIEFTWKHHQDGNLSVSLTQQSFAETLIESLGFTSTSVSMFTTPYRSGFAIDPIPHQSMSFTDRDYLCLNYQSLVGSFNWLAHTTRPDLSTAESLLAQHESNPSSGHLEAACYVVKYLSNTKTFGYLFYQCKTFYCGVIFKFPLPNHVLSMFDANWGPKDASQSKSIMELPLFASLSMSAFYVDLFGPLHWMSTQQTATAGSSAEAEEYATNECVKFLLELVQIFEFLAAKDILCQV